jgi:O-antigen/teichoic acid export membrane protein
MLETPSPEEHAHAHALAAIVRGMAAAMLASMAGGGFAFLLLVVMGRLLSQSEFGLFVLAANFVSAAALMTIAGADVATIRYVAAATTPGAKRGAMLTPVTLVIPLNVAIAALTVALAAPIADHVFRQPDFAAPLRAAALVIPLTVLAQMLSAAVSGLERVSGEFARKVVEQGGRLLLVPLAVVVGFGVVGAILAMAAAAVLATAAVAAILIRKLPRGGETEPIGARRVLAFAWPQTIAAFAPQLWLLGTFAFLAQESGAKAVAIFGAALALARVGALIYSAFVFRFSPTISRLWEEQKLVDLDRLLKSVTRWVAILAVPVYAVAVALPGPLLHLFGDEYRSGRWILALAALAFLFDSLAGPVESVLMMTGRVRLEMAANVIAGSTMLPVSYVLIHSYGLTGAAVATLAYNLVLNALKMIFVWRALRMHSLSLALLTPLSAAAAGGGVAALVEHQAVGLGSTLAGTAALAALVFVVYLVLLLRVFGLSHADRRALRLSIRPET